MREASLLNDTPGTRTSKRMIAGLLTPWILLLFGVASAAPAESASPAGGVETMIPRLIGGWAGEENDTPMGPMPFAMLWDERADGSLHSRSALNRETYLDFVLWRDDAGRWMLTEEGGMEGLGVQKHTLAFAGPGAAEGLYRWSLEERPDFLSVELGVVEEQMVMEVTLRGAPHASFRLARQPAESWPQMRRQMAAQAQLDPEEGVSIREVLEEAAARPAEVASGDPIAAARERTREEPGNGEAWLALAEQLGAAINEDPSNGPRYAFEMLDALQRSLAADPTLVEAYHWLVGYYLSAPPIAGGSVDRARETAEALAAFDAVSAAVLFEQIEAAASAPEEGP